MKGQKANSSSPGSLAPLSNRGKDYTKMHSPAYFSPYLDPAGNVHTVDKIRLKITLKPTQDRDIDCLNGIYDTAILMCEKANTFESTKPGQYRTVVTLGYGCMKANPDYETGKPGTPRLLYDPDLPGAFSVALGLGFNHPDGHNVYDTGFCEFNPNKASFAALRLLRAIESRFEVVFEVERWDYAIDLSIPRSEVLLYKDKRNYEAVISQSMTQYLGRRNTAGRVKLYDKAAESGLEYPLTRLEITYARPSFTPDGAPQLPNTLWPYAGAVRGVGECPPTTAALVTALNQLFQLGQDIEPVLQVLEVRKRAEVRKLLTPEPLPFNPAAWSWCALRACAWENPCTSELLRDNAHLLDI